MELTYATSFDSEDIRNWSGLGVYYAKMLRHSGFNDLNCLSLSKKSIFNSAIRFVNNKIFSHLSGKEALPIFGEKQSKFYARMIEGQMKNGSFILSPNTVVLAHLRKDIKKILYTDSTLDNLLNFYPNYCNLPEDAVSEAQELERLTTENSDLLIYSSQWAADSAIKNYHANPQKVFVVPFGANLQFVPTNREVESIIRKRNIKKHIHLLFMGVDWKRKGGEYAVQVTHKLNELGIATTLHIAGIRDIQINLNKRFVVAHRFISKGSVKQETRLCKLIAQSDFLILPSLADCTPVVFSEANAFGVPCLASQVGGHSTIIKDGINGKTWPRNQFVENCASYIYELAQSKNSYEDLCFSSRNVYLNELNWKTAGNKIHKLITSI